jgi:hypothetical protein
LAKLTILGSTARSRCRYPACRPAFGLNSFFRRSTAENKAQSIKQANKKASGRWKHCHLPGRTSSTNYAFRKAHQASGQAPSAEELSNWLPPPHPNHFPPKTLQAKVTAQRTWKLKRTYLIRGRWYRYQYQCQRLRQHTVPSARARGEVHAFLSSDSRASGETVRF